MNSRLPIRTRLAERTAAEFPSWALFLAVGIALSCLFGGLGKLGLVGADDPRYAFIARAMLQTGDWVTPRLYGQPWLEKPILYYWAAAAAFRVFGVTEFAARLPSALAALLATVAMAWAASRAYGRDAAILATLLFPTTIAAIAFARAASPDMLFSALLAAAAAVAAEILAHARPAIAMQIAFGIFLGGATLAKGPAAVILAGGAVLLWALLSRNWRAVLRLLNPVALTSFLIVALPWYVLCAIRNPDFFHIFIVQHNFERYLTPMFEHPQPFWFFGAIILLATVPWTGLLIPMGISAWRRISADTWRDSPALFFGCWTVFPILFFSFSKSKLPGYILPAVPPLTLLIAASAARLLVAGGRLDLTGGIARQARGSIALTGCLFIILPLTAGYWLRDLPAESGFVSLHSVAGLLAFTIAGGTFCAFLALVGRLRSALLVEAALMTLLLLAVNASVLPKLDRYVSPRALAAGVPLEAVQAASLSTSQLATSELATFELDREWIYGLNFYLDRELRQWMPGAEQPTWIFTTARGAADLDRLGVKYFIIERVSTEAWLIRVAR